ncbi:MAG: TrbG/VirB9 family P-type conjugative transfer protein [Gammaproteobacteria bacterium]|nr:TrbG/VirB9 family P-type conjugative transfer protein [Gammaproteobacteria bacterium]
MRNIFMASMFTLIGMHSGMSFAESFPRHVTADNHVKVVMYDPNNVVVLQGRYGYQTQITFSPAETVQSVSIGDSLAWQAVPVNNNLFIKPVASSKTNMTVLTNLNSYNFQLESLSSQIRPTYKLQFTYPDGNYDASGISNAVGNFDPEKLNWKYTFTGDRSLVPLEAFDNGQFTYFKFKNDGMSHIPSVFIVDKDKNETLVNYHMQGEYLVVNSIAKQFTFRDGSSVTSIYNDFAIGDWKNI